MLVIIKSTIERKLQLMLLLVKQNEIIDSKCHQTKTIISHNGFFFFS